MPAGNVRRMFHLFAYQPLTVEALIERLHSEGLTFRDSTPRFPKSSIYNMLSDRAYIGEIEFRGQWYQGKHEPLVDRATWDRVQALLGGHVYHAHQMTYAGEFITCAHCGHPITGERKIKKTLLGERAYVYYRCGFYNVAGHPRSRTTEAELDRQVLAVFDGIRIDEDDVREWFREVLRSQTRDSQQESLAQREELKRQETLIIAQQDRLLNLRIEDEIEQEAFARKHTELRDRLGNIKLQLDVIDRSHDETAEVAAKVFELSQTLRQQWVVADYVAKRRILEIVFLNCRLDDVTLVPTIRKPFDVLAEGPLLKNSRGDKI